MSQRAETVRRYVPLNMCLKLEGGRGKGTSRHGDSTVCTMLEKRDLCGRETQGHPHPLQKINKDITSSKDTQESLMQCENVRDVCLVNNIWLFILSCISNGKVANQSSVLQVYRSHETGNLYERTGKVRATMVS